MVSIRLYPGAMCATVRPYFGPPTASLARLSAKLENAKAPPYLPSSSCRLYSTHHTSSPSRRRIGAAYLEPSECLLRVDSGPLLSLWDLLKPLAPTMTTMGGQNGSSMQHARHKKSPAMPGFLVSAFLPPPEAAGNRRSGDFRMLTKMLTNRGQNHPKSP